MNELSKIWYLDMLSREIKDIKEAIANETLWLNAAENAEELNMSQENINAQEEYLQLLQEKYQQLIEEFQLEEDKSCKIR